MHYVAPRWLPGGNLQTIWPALFARRTAGPPPAYRRERWDTPDGDFIDVDFLRRAEPAAGRREPLLVLFHGLEGSSASHYAQAFADCARGARLGLRGAAFPRLQRRDQPRAARLPLGRLRGDRLDPRALRGAAGARRGRRRRCCAVGVSLGGNALLRWAEEAGDDGAPRRCGALAAVSAPLDLAAGGAAIGRGFNRQVYTRMFLAHHEAQGAGQAGAAPGPVRPRARCWRRATCYDFDNVFTAPLHGFRDTDDYWSRGSAKPHLHAIRVPTLVVNARQRPVRAGGEPAAAGRGRRARHAVAAARMAAMSAFRSGCRPAMCAACPSVWAAGSQPGEPLTGRAASAVGAQWPHG